MGASSAYFHATLSLLGQVWLNIIYYSHNELVAYSIANTSFHHIQRQDAYIQGWRGCQCIVFYHRTCIRTIQDYAERQKKLKQEPFPVFSQWQQLKQVWIEPELNQTETIHLNHSNQENTLFSVRLYFSSRIHKLCLQGILNVTGNIMEYEPCYQTIW